MFSQNLDGINQLLFVILCKEFLVVMLVKCNKNTVIFSICVCDVWQVLEKSHLPERLTRTQIPYIYYGFPVICSWSAVDVGLANLKLHFDSNCSAQ
jgi:hypothetical protein